MTETPNIKPSLKIRMNDWWYRNVKRRQGNFGRRIIWMFPKRVVYWCVIRAAVEVEPNYNPSQVTAEEMLKKFNY